MPVRKTVTFIAATTALVFATSHAALSVYARVPPRKQVKGQTAHPSLDALQGVTWVRVPEGSCRVGEGSDVRTLTLSGPLTISATPVTNRQYARFLQATGKAAPVFPLDSRGIKFIRDLAPQFTWDGLKPPKGFEDYPVAFVSLRDANAYCRWLSQQTGQPYRLPHRSELSYCLALRPRTETDFGIHPQWYEPKWLHEFVAWYGLSAVSVTGEATAKPTDWGKPRVSRFKLKHYPQSLMEWTDDNSVSSYYLGAYADATETHNYSMHAAGIELHVFGLCLVAASK